MPLMTEIPENWREPAARMVTSLRGLDRVLVAAHVNPDGDALGSMSALGWLLKDMGKEFVLYSPSGVPDYLSFLPLPCTLLTSLERLPFEPQALVLLDCGEDKPDGTEVYYGMNDFTQYRKDQAQFLQTELAGPEFTAAARKVLIHHIPIYGNAVAKFNPCKELWQPHLAAAGFDVSLNGHLHRYELIEKGASENNFPVVIGGGYKEENATVMILKKTGERLNLRVVHAKGNTLLNRAL